MRFQSLEAANVPIDYAENIRLTQRLGMLTGQS